MALGAVANRIGSDCFAGKKVDHDIGDGGRSRHAETSLKERRKKERGRRRGEGRKKSLPASHLLIHLDFFDAYFRTRVYPVYVASLKGGKILDNARGCIEFQNKNRSRRPDE